MSAPIIRPRPMSELVGLAEMSKHDYERTTHRPLYDALREKLQDLPEWQAYENSLNELQALDLSIEALRHIEQHKTPPAPTLVSVAQAPRLVAAPEVSATAAPEVAQTTKSDVSLPSNQETKPSFAFAGSTSPHHTATSEKPIHTKAKSIPKSANEFVASILATHGPLSLPGMIDAISKDYGRTLKYATVYTTVQTAAKRGFIRKDAHRIWHLVAPR